MSDDKSYPNDKADLFKRIEGEWSGLVGVVETLTEAQLNAPGPGGWSIKDNLAHLAAWERFMRLHYLGGHPAHEAMAIDPATFERLDEDGVNAVLHERNRDRPAAEILAELKRTHRETLAALDGMSYADLMRQRFTEDPQARPLVAWVIGNTYEHYREHREIIDRMLGT